MNQQVNLDDYMASSLVHMPEKVKKDTKLVSDSEISKITLKNFPKTISVSITIFQICQWGLLICSCVQLLFRRYCEYDDLMKIEAEGVTQSEKEEFYSFTGIIYAKYNLEILNFVFYLLLLSNLHQLNMKHYFLKIFLGEGLLIGLIFWKVLSYLEILGAHSNKNAPISLGNIMVELGLLILHVVIIISFSIAFFGFRKSREAKNIYRVHYLGKKIKRVA